MAEKLSPFMQREKSIRVFHSALIPNSTGNSTVSSPMKKHLIRLKAIEDIKRDMESEKPMDRLICGDVGYGKTEVAMRAAFKAVYDGMQVAVLVPTTILCEQHYRTFRTRFSAFPVRIDYLSRFKSKKDQKETIKALSSGDIDIIIGTHGLLRQGYTSFINSVFSSLTKNTGSGSGRKKR